MEPSLLLGLKTEFPGTPARTYQARIFPTRIEWEIRRLPDPDLVHHPEWEGWAGELDYAHTEVIDREFWDDFLLRQELQERVKYGLIILARADAYRAGYSQIESGPRAWVISEGSVLPTHLA